MRRTIRLLVVLTALLSACQERNAAAPPAPAVADAGAGVTEEACVDSWLAGRKLDPYGSAEGTMYAGGSPLFDERTGESKDRLEFVYARHPEAKIACRK
ncbi:MAG: hypothetical protein M3Y59_23985 [Myxococcota bacterium]|nr:hypothetical protein [Myxococcota bacterium]